MKRDELFLGRMIVDGLFWGVIILIAIPLILGIKKGVDDDEQQRATVRQTTTIQTDVYESKGG